MDVRKFASAPFRFKPWKPLHRRLILQNLGGSWEQPVCDHAIHVRAAIQWLCRAQDEREGLSDAGGVSAGWSFEDGWLPSYPETTGYIIETFVAGAEYLDEPSLLERANRMIEWERSVQLPDGAFPGHFGEVGSRPVIFNTGQIMHGMNVAYEKLGRDDCLASAVLAGHWLVRQQSGDGAWYKYEHNDVPHVYNTRATWALLKTSVLAGDAELKDAAIRNLDWALEQQLQNGWFKNNAFTLGDAPFTHTIAYAIRGLLESGLLLNDERYIRASTVAATAVASKQRGNGWLAGTLDEQWESRDRYCCLTGLAQMCLNWSRIRDTCGSKAFEVNIDSGLRFLKSTQRVNDPADEVRGGIAGSMPIWGKYSRFEYPNWAAKFFVDALLLNVG